MFSFPVACYRTTRERYLLAFGGTNHQAFALGGALDGFDRFLSDHRGTYTFCFLSYELKNEIERLESNNADLLEFPALWAWSPSCVVSVDETSVTWLQGDASDENKAFVGEFQANLGRKTNPLPRVSFRARTSKERYVAAIHAVHQEIQQGNTYELNYCQEFFAEKVPEFDSFSLINRLFEVTQAPFSAYLSFPGGEIFCGSPERYMQRVGNRLISQPIKGTIRRGATPAEDEQLKQTLYHNPKERTENVMITDLVRNDLSRVALRNSVQVDELFGVYEFATVHHMISTVSCELSPDRRLVDVIRATFPMGSMTGAPKISSMQICERLEDFKRGLYSGAIGYVTPTGDFDFNVVIRSLLYRRDLAYLSCAVGSAITSQANASQEYDECLLKVQRILGLFSHD